MKKKILLFVVIFIAFALVFLMTTGLLIGKPVQVKGPWVTKVEGSGIVSGGSLSSYGVSETDLGWNFKINADGQIKGQLNIVEKLEDGKVRHFKLFGYEVTSIDRTNCGTYEIRVEGTNADGFVVAAHFRGTRNSYRPNSVWYWVKDGGTFITNTGTQLTVSDTFYVNCD